jgi:hypothetical protein
VSRLFKIYLLVVLSVFSTLNLSANDTFFSIEKRAIGIDLIDAWEKLIDIPNIRTNTNFLETTSKWIDDGIDVTFSSAQDGAKILNKNGDEIGQFIKNGSDDILVIDDDLFVSVGTPKSFETVAVNGNTGEILTNCSYVKNADGTIGFIEDVTSYGSQSVQYAIKHRGDLRGTIQGIQKGQEAHHYIPVKLLKENDVVKKAVEGGFDFNNGAVNGVALDKYVASSGLGRHSKHNNYTNQIRSSLDDWALNNPGYFSSAHSNIQSIVFVEFVAVIIFRVSVPSIKESISSTELA